MPIQSISPAEAARLCADGAKLLDIRSADEFARARAPQAESAPLDTLGSVQSDGPVIFMCKSGMRTGSNADRLASCAAGDAYLLEGGLDGWRKAGLPVDQDTSQPIEIMRQVQIAAGSLVLLGVVLGWLVSPVWLALAAFVGAGLTFAGASGWCGMAKLLALMPWNRAAHA